MKDYLYNLLPAFYREQDQQQGEPLRLLLKIMEQELNNREAEVTQAYANCFIELCEPKFLPYIAALLGVTNLPCGLEVDNQRSIIANTLSYRQRKGCVDTLERVIRDSIGWPAKLVEFNSQLLYTQHLKHPQFNSTTACIRDLSVMGSLNGPFDQNTHLLQLSDRQPIKYAIDALGIFLWRLKVYPIKNSTAGKIAERCYTFHPLGVNTPLYHFPQHNRDTEFLPAQEINLPVAITRLMLQKDLQHKHFQYYGNDIALYDESGKLIPAEQIIVTNLSTLTAVSLANDQIAIDPELGRIVFASNLTPPTTLSVDYNYALSGDIGGGPYFRKQTLDITSDDYIVYLSKNSSVNLEDTLTKWATQQIHVEKVIIEITDNATYLLKLPDSLTASAATLSKLIIRAANGVRPCVKFINDVLPLPANTRLELEGLMLNGKIVLQPNTQLNVMDCTLYAPAGAITYAIQTTNEVSLAIDQTEIIIQKSIIIGAILLPAQILSLTIEDSILDGQKSLALKGMNDKEAGPRTILERVTVIGGLQVIELPFASSSLITNTLNVLRWQTGCIRYSYLPINTIAPPHFHCQFEVEDKSTTSANLKNNSTLVFTSTIYGQPGYAQLTSESTALIKAGAENRNEMGAFCNFQSSLKETQLAGLLLEYLPLTGSPVVTQYVN